MRSIDRKIYNGIKALERTTPQEESMSEEKQPTKKAIKVKIEVDDELAGGNYANLCLVNHSDSEFVIDAFFLQPQKPVAKHATRLVLSPRSAKRLYKLLGDRLNKFEKLFGEVKIQPGETPDIIN